MTIILLLCGCTEQRDLYTVARPQIYIEGNWEPTLHQTNMSMNATAMLYAADGRMVSKNYFVSPRSVTVAVARGTYDILLFNGMMYSENDTHLDNVSFRGTDRLETFEAVVAEGEPNRRLLRNGSEYIASNEMELLTSAGSKQEVTGESGYFIKYKDGQNGYPTHEDYVEAELYLTPSAVSYECRIVVDLINPSSAHVANGALRGFAGSVFMASRVPSHQEATHQFRLNDLEITGSDPERGSIRSPLFVTFGPPLDLPDRRYSVEVNIVLVDGETLEETFDVTDQVAQVIERIKEGLSSGELVEASITIPIRIAVELPIVDPVQGSIGVGDWEEDEIIKVPIKWRKLKSSEFEDS